MTQAEPNAPFAGRVLENDELKAVSGGDKQLHGLADGGAQSLVNSLINNLAGALQVGGCHG